MVVLYAPTLNGLFIETYNYIPANPLQTPPDVTPAWYLAPYYAMLRAIPKKELGILVLFLAIIAPFFLPWLDRNHKARSIRYRPVYFGMILVLVACLLVLGWIGMQPASPALLPPARICLGLYFLFFISLPFDQGRARAGEDVVKAALALVFVVVGVAPVFAVEEGPKLDTPHYRFDRSTIRKGATLFATHCLSCHGLKHIRYQRLQSDLGIDAAKIEKDIMLPDGAEMNEGMTVTMRPEDAKKWFGAAPPDLTLAIVGSIGFTRT